MTFDPRNRDTGQASLPQDALKGPAAIKVSQRTLFGLSQVFKLLADRVG